VPGDGRIEWPHIVETLRQASFAGWVMLELHCPDGDLGPFFEAAMGRARMLEG
jgi:sugar phosphate isomerase/epimerase